MTNTKNNDEDGKRIIIAIIIVLLALAAFLIPNPPEEIPTLEVEKEPVSMIRKAYAADDHIVGIDKMVVEKPVEKSIPELHPNLKVICSCESTGIPDGKPEHYESDGVTVLSGRVDPRDRGMCQISSFYWGQKAQELGYDIETPTGNTQMANYIFEHQGSQPWSASKKCHGK